MVELAFVNVNISRRTRDRYPRSRSVSGKLSAACLPKISAGVSAATFVLLIDSLFVERLAVHALLPGAMRFFVMAIAAAGLVMCFVPLDRRLERFARFSCWPLPRRLPSSFGSVRQRRRAPRCNLAR